jgi:NitT/TauT family transport system substrate-binding protein
VYIFLGPGGIMTVDPTIKPELVRDAGEDAKVLQRLDRMKEFDIGRWVNDSYVRRAFAESGLDYDKQAKSFDNYEISGTDEFCRQPIAEPRKAGEIWTADQGITAYASAACALAAYADLKRKGKKINVAYLFDSTRGIKLFADQAFFAVSGDGGKATIEPFLLKKDAEAAAKKNGGRVVGFTEAVKAAGGA